MKSSKPVSVDSFIMGSKDVQIKKNKVKMESKFVIKMSSSLHTEIKLEAVKNGITMNEYIRIILENRKLLQFKS